MLKEINKENKSTSQERVQRLTENKVLGRFQTTSFLNLIHEIHDSNKSLIKALQAKSNILKLPSNDNLSEVI